MICLYLTCELTIILIGYVHNVDFKDKLSYIRVVLSIIVNVMCYKFIVFFATHHYAIVFLTKKFDFKI